MRSRSSSRVIGTLAALAVAVVGLLPSVHAHTQGDDTVVHRHVIADRSAHHDEDAGHHDEDVDHRDAILDHDDHLAAPTLLLAYEVVALFGMTCSLAATRLSAGQTRPRIVRHENRATLLPTHDPPLRFVCSPAPPSFL